MIGFQIYSCCCFIQNEDLGFAEKGPGQAHKLPLPNAGMGWEHGLLGRQEELGNCQPVLHTALTPALCLPSPPWPCPS